VILLSQKAAHLMTGAAKCRLISQSILNLLEYRPKINALPSEFMGIHWNHSELTSCWPAIRRLSLIFSNQLKTGELVGISFLIIIRRMDPIIEQTLKSTGKTES
jgi:hypothetical protein